MFVACLAEDQRSRRMHRDVVLRPLSGDCHVGFLDALMVMLGVDGRRGEEHQAQHDSVGHHGSSRADDLAVAVLLRQVPRNLLVPVIPSADRRFGVANR